MIDEIREAIKEIVAVFLVIGAIYDLANLQTIIDLGNLFYAGQIGIGEYLIRITLQFIILPAIPSIVLGIIVNRIREFVGQET